MILPWYAPVQCSKCAEALVRPQLPYYLLTMQFTSATSQAFTMTALSAVEMAQQADDEIRCEQETAADQVALGE